MNNGIQRSDSGGLTLYDYTRTPPESDLGALSKPFYDAAFTHTMLAMTLVYGACFITYALFPVDGPRYLTGPALAPHAVPLISTRCIGPWAAAPHGPAAGTTISPACPHAAKCSVPSVAMSASRRIASRA